MSADEAQEILGELRHLRAEQAAFRELLAPLVTRKLSRKAQAKAAGCSVRTLSRREKAAARKLTMQGIL